MTYKYSNFTALIFLISSLVFPFLCVGFSYFGLKLHEVRFKVLDGTVALIMELMLIGCYIETKTFFFTIQGDSVTTGTALHRTSFKISELTCVQIVQGRGNTDNSLYLWRNRKVMAKLFYYLNDFQSVMALLKLKVEASGGTFKQSEWRKKNQWRRSQDYR